VVLFAKTSKALPRLNKLFAEHEKVRKTYWAIVGKENDGSSKMEDDGVWHTSTHWLTRNEKANTARAYDREVPNSKKAVLKYRFIAHSDRYRLVEVELMTGRHHQIRCQLAKMGCPIKGDLKYGAPRSNPDGSICLHARKLELEHPVTHELISITAPVPQNTLWQAFEND
jgi:23S rRNA pseudouridine1911/1915/1917 synthase